MPKCMPTEVTMDWLIMREACYDTREEFRKVFGDRAEITPENILKARRRMRGWQGALSWLLKELDDDRQLYVRYDGEMEPILDSCSQQFFETKKHTCKKASYKLLRKYILELVTSPRPNPNKETTT